MHLDENTVRDTISTIYTNGKQSNTPLQSIMQDIYSRFDFRKFNVNDRVTLSQIILSMLSREDRTELARQLLQEQVSHQRVKLAYWSNITSQSSQIDTGYIAQHLVSLITQIPGQGMRGKGDDLIDGSEVKSANFLDSMDKAGATAPRWNFTAVEVYVMERFLTYSDLYLVSIDLNPQGRFRTRIWKVDITKHDTLRNRYIEWMQKLGYPKFANTAKRQSVNFQLFPPKIGTNETFARHGNGREDGFEKLAIQLEGVEGSKLIFHSEENEHGVIDILKFG